MVNNLIKNRMKLLIKGAILAPFSKRVTLSHLVTPWWSMIGMGKHYL